MSLGCVSPGSLSILGRGTGAPQSGIYNLWAAGPRQGAAATQHVSTPQGAVSSPTCDLALLSPSFHPFVSAFQQSGCVPEIQDFSNPPPGSVKNISSFVPGVIGHVPPPLQPHLLLHWSRMKSPSERKNTVTQLYLSRVMLTSGFHN